MFGILKGTTSCKLYLIFGNGYTYVIVSHDHYLMFSALVESITSSPSTDDETPSKDGSRCRYD